VKFDLSEACDENNAKNIVHVNSPETSMTHLKLDKKKRMA
jgi:hypothetical protein